MSAPNVLGYALAAAAVAQWVVVVHTTVQRRGGEAWLAWMIRSKDSLSSLFSHCSLTTTGSPSSSHRIGGPPPSRRRRRSLFLRALGTLR